MKLYYDDSSTKNRLSARCRELDERFEIAKMEFFEAQCIDDDEPTAEMYFWSFVAKNTAVEIGDISERI